MRVRIHVEGGALGDLDYSQNHPGSSLSDDNTRRNLRVLMHEINAAVVRVYGLEAKTE